MLDLHEIHRIVQRVPKRHSSSSPSLQRLHLSKRRDWHCYVIINYTPGFLWISTTFSILFLSRDPTQGATLHSAVMSPRRLWSVTVSSSSLIFVLRSPGQVLAEGLPIANVFLTIRLELWIFRKNSQGENALLRHIISSYVAFASHRHVTAFLSKWCLSFEHLHFIGLHMISLNKVITNTNMNMNGRHRIKSKRLGQYGGFH